MSDTPVPPPSPFVLEYERASETAKRSDYNAAYAAAQQIHNAAELFAAGSLAMRQALPDFKDASEAQISVMAALLLRGSPQPEGIPAESLRKKRMPNDTIWQVVLDRSDGLLFTMTDLAVKLPKIPMPKLRAALARFHKAKLIRIVEKNPQKNVWALTPRGESTRMLPD